jgi:translation initiation factor IF-3
VVFRGREITHQELGMAALDKFATELQDIAVVEVKQKLEGRSMFMIVAPKVKVTK